MSESDCSRPSSPGGLRFTSCSSRTIALHDVQKMCSRERALAQADLAVLEELADLVAVVDRVVVALLEVSRTDALERIAQVADQLVLACSALGAGIVARLEARDVEDVEEQHRVVGDGRAARLGDDHRVRDALRVEHGHDGLDDVAAVLVERVVPAVVEVGLRAVVVDRQAAAEVEVAPSPRLPARGRRRTGRPRARRCGCRGCSGSASRGGSAAAAGSRACSCCLSASTARRSARSSGRRCCGRRPTRSTRRSTREASLTRTPSIGRTPSARLARGRSAARPASRARRSTLKPSFSACRARSMNSSSL